MNILKEYKTFDNKTGEIKIDCQLCDEHKGDYAVIVNGRLVSVSDKFSEVNHYYFQLLEMDKYISSKVRSYEVYEVIV